MPGHMKYPLCNAAVLALIIWAATVHAGGADLVRHRAYDVWPEPTHDSRYGADTTAQHLSLLTDGFTNYRSGDISTQKTAVTWFHPLGEPIVVRFDLGQAATLDEVRFNTAGGPEPGYMWDPEVRVYTSLDDKGYMLAGEWLPQKRPKSLRGIQVVVELRGARARYVAVAAMAPAPRYVVAVDEIEVMGEIVGEGSTNSLRGRPIRATGPRQLQEALAEAARASRMMRSLLEPTGTQAESWPAWASGRQRADVREFLKRSAGEPGEYDRLRAEAVLRHRLLARRVYRSDTLAWEVPPDAPFGMLSLPDQPAPAETASVSTAVNALEATALGAANLTDKPQLLAIGVSGGGPGAPTVVPRVGRFFLTANSRYVADALLATDSPQTIPSGESRLVWLACESTGAEPGTYRYEVTVAIGQQVHRVALQVVVFAVTLPPETPLATFNWAYLNAGSPLFEKVRTAMLSHRITVGACSSVGWPRKDAQGNVIRPVEIEDSAQVDKYLDFNRDFPQISFYFPFDYAANAPTGSMFGTAAWMSPEFRAVFREWVTALVRQLKAKGRGYGDFHLQMFDETFDPKVGELCRLVHEADPEVRTMITIPEATTAAVQGFVDAGMNIFTYHAPRLRYDNAPDGFPLLRSGGRQLWFYHASDAAAGEGRERDPLDAYRLLHWLAFRHGATGVGFWDMVHNSTSCWAEGPGQAYYPMVYTVSADSPPPPDVGTAETVIPSRRWEYTRMGIEDYLLLQMAQRQIAALAPGPRARYAHKLDGIVRTVLDALPALPAATSEDDRLAFRQKRAELLQMVEELDRRAGSM
jgi:hypothetical protein